MSRILAIDPGEKNIGVAVSDESGTIANPLTVIPHRSRRSDAARIVELTGETGAAAIVVGQSLGEDGLPTPMGRHAARLADELRQMTSLPIYLWDEHGSTIAARRARIDMGVSRSKRSGHLDQLAATVILQTYLDANRREEIS